MHYVDVRLYTITGMAFYFKFLLSLFILWIQCCQHLELLLESIPTMFLENRTAESAFGAATKVCQFIWGKFIDKWSMENAIPIQTIIKSDMNMLLWSLFWLWIAMNKYPDMLIQASFWLFLGPWSIYRC